MKNEICELVFVLDRSGSMYGLESDTAGGFNRVLEEQKNGKGKVFVTKVLFNHQTEVLHEHVLIDAMPEMTAEDVASGGKHHIAGRAGQRHRDDDQPAAQMSAASACRSGAVRHHDGWAGKCQHPLDLCAAAAADRTGKGRPWLGILVSGRQYGHCERSVPTGHCP